MIDLAAHPEGVLLPVRAQPGARANAIRGTMSGMLKVAVTQVAEKGKANDAVIETLAYRPGPQAVAGRVGQRGNQPREKAANPRRIGGGIGQPELR